VEDPRDDTVGLPLQFARAGALVSEHPLELREHDNGKGPPVTVLPGPGFEPDNPCPEIHLTPLQPAMSAPVEAI
jgi:hypothetical protein